MTTPEPTGFLDRTITVAGNEHRYVVYVPPHYTRRALLPLVMFLHGKGECGTDGHKQIEVGLGPAIGNAPERWPFVVVFPQKPDPDSQWAEHDALVMATLAATEKEYSIFGRFLTGLSQGGAGTWALGAKHSDVWEALAPVCGYGRPAEVAPLLKNKPIWAFHGLDDPTVPAQQSKDLCAAVEAAGGGPVLTLYEHTAHNSWDQAYRDSDLAEWLRVVGNSSPGHMLGLALAAPERATRFLSMTGGLEVVSSTRLLHQGEYEVRETRLSTDAAGWHVSDVRSRDVRKEGKWQREPLGEPIERTVSAPEVTRCLHDSVRLLVRSGVCDHREYEDIDGDSIEIDFVPGIGGRSLSAWPKRWRVDSKPSEPVEVIRRVAARIRQLR
ncbi:MAG TPA: hypothetical protein VFZ65_10560 [Planctomycetota bacterium]|nr:hypothetical protein [Planctomycetota bacterium]